jgi:Fe-S-cluster containining protein
MPAVSDSDTEVCFSCGACCFGPENYVQVFDEDLENLTADQVARLTVSSTLPADPRKPGGSEPGRFMRMENGHCAALDRSGGKFRCSIYAARPMVCAAYQMYAAESACPPRDSKDVRAAAPSA